MNKGDIVLVRFPFTDLSSEKLRPALVITPQINKEELCDILISSKDTDFNRTGLKRDSIIKTNKLATLNKRIIAGKIGVLSAKNITEVNTALKQILRL